MSYLFPHPNVISEQWERQWYHQSRVRFDWTLHNCTTMSVFMIQMSWQPNRKQKWETVKDLFLAQGQHSPQSGGIHFETAEAYRPTLTEEENKYLRPTLSYSLLLLHSSHKREHSCSIASWGKSQRQAMFKRNWFTFRQAAMLQLL